MRVAFSLLTLLPGRIGGSETYARALLEAFRKTDGGADLEALLPHDLAGTLGPDVRVRPIAGYRAGSNDLSRAAAMAAELFRRRRLPGYDVVHYPLTVPIPRFDIPAVVTLHDLRHLELPGTSSRLERRYRAWSYDRAARRADCVVVPSEHARRVAIERLGLEDRRVAAIEHGVDHGRFRPGSAEPDRGDLPDRYLLYPANLWPHKNHEQLLEAFAGIEDHDVALVLTGEPYARLSLLEQHARRLGVAERVHHLGRVAGERLPDLYRSALALVFASRYEGFGAPPLEAMACGCPVACSTAGSLGELWAGAALTFDPDDVGAMTSAINAIIQDERLRAELRERGLSRAAEFDWRVSAERHLEVYERASRS